MSSTGSWSNLCPGSYTVELSTTCCVPTCSINLTFNTGIVNYLDNNRTIRIYPNPAINSVKIVPENLLERISEIEIINALGESVLVSSFRNEIDISQLPSGYYTLKLSSEKHQFHSKFIKK
jgi:hypothetical protein